MPAVPRYNAPNIGSILTAVGQGSLEGLDLGTRLATDDINRKIALENLAAQKRAEERSVADWLSSGVPDQPFDQGGAPATVSRGGVRGPAVEVDAAPSSIGDLAMEAWRVKQQGPVQGDHLVWGRQPGVPMEVSAAPAVLTPTVGDNPLATRLGFAPHYTPPPQAAEVYIRRMVVQGKMSPSQAENALFEYKNWYDAASRESGRRGQIAADAAARLAAERAQAEQDALVAGYFQTLKARQRRDAGLRGLDDNALMSIARSAVTEEGAVKASMGDIAAMEGEVTKAGPGNRRVTLEQSQYDDAVQGLAANTFNARAQAGDIDRLAMQLVGIDPERDNAAMAWGFIPPAKQKEAIAIATHTVQQESLAQGRAAAESPTARATMALTRLPQQTEPQPLRRKEWKPDEVLPAEDAYNFLVTGGVPDAQAQALATGTLSLTALRNAVVASHRERFPGGIAPPGGATAPPGGAAPVLPVLTQQADGSWMSGSGRAIPADVGQHLIETGRATQG